MPFSEIRAPESRETETESRTMETGMDLNMGIFTPRSSTRHGFVLASKHPLKVL